MKSYMELVGKSLLPIALVVCAFKLSSSLQEPAKALREAAASVNDAASKTEQIAANAPKTAGDAGHAAGEGFVKGTANGAVQVAATPALAPVAAGADALGKGVGLSDRDRDHVNRVLNPKRWRIF